MAKKSYVGIGNQAKNIPKGYIGINNVAKKIVKGYIGVNDVACLFWGGGGVDFEYDYKVGKDFQIHNNLTPEDVMDAVFNEFIERAVPLQIPYLIPSAAHVIGYRSFYKQKILDMMDESDIPLSDVTTCSFGIQSGAPEPTQEIQATYLFMNWGDDSYPMRARITNERTGAFDTKYYQISTNITPRPTAKYIIQIYCYNDHDDIRDVRQLTPASIPRIGFFERTSHGTSPFPYDGVDVVLASFGMKKED